jgi:hypothetical protein
MMRKFKTVQAEKVIVQPYPGQLSVAGLYLAEKLKGIPIIREDQWITAPRPTVDKGILVFHVRDIFL